VKNVLDHRRAGGRKVNDLGRRTWIAPRQWLMESLSARRWHRRTTCPVRQACSWRLPQRPFDRPSLGRLLRVWRIPSDRRRAQARPARYHESFKPSLELSVFGECLARLPKWPRPGGHPGARWDAAAPKRPGFDRGDSPDPLVRKFVESWGYRRTQVSSFKGMEPIADAGTPFRCRGSPRRVDHLSGK
jgi:hypothetical protein